MLSKEDFLFYIGEINNQCLFVLEEAEKNEINSAEAKGTIDFIDHLISEMKKEISTY